MDAFVAVYLKFFRGWSYVQIGWLSLATNLAAFVCQAPVGDLLDKMQNKKLLTICACIISAITTTSITWTRVFWIIMICKALEGVSTVPGRAETRFSLDARRGSNRSKRVEAASTRVEAATARRASRQHLRAGRHRAGRDVAAAGRGADGAGGPSR